jgi:FMN phosphatase YigB (HAD superfamily)
MRGLFCTLALVLCLILPFDALYGHSSASKGPTKSPDGALHSHKGPDPRRRSGLRLDSAYPFSESVDPFYRSESTLSTPEEEITNNFGILDRSGRQEVLVLDIDGTLYDDACLIEEQIKQNCERFALEYGYEADESQRLHEMYGSTIRGIVEEGRQDRESTVRAYYNAAYDSLDMSLLQKYSGIHTATEPSFISHPAQQQPVFAVPPRPAGTGYSAGAAAELAQVTTWLFSGLSVVSSFALARPVDEYPPHLALLLIPSLSTSPAPPPLDPPQGLRALRGIARLGVPIVLASNSPAFHVRRVMKRIGLAGTCLPACTDLIG